MARREYWIRLKCAEPGCPEVSNFVAETRKEEAETYARYANNPWRCVRHTRPHEVLSGDNPERVAVLTVGPDERYPHLPNLYWNPTEGCARIGSGSIYGPGFKAYASDFPSGTRLIVTARIELPEVPADDR